MMNAQQMADARREAEGGTPQAPREPAFTAPTVPYNQHENLPSEHPVLTGLKRDLLASAIPMEDVDVGSHLWKMAALDGGDVTFVERVADSASISDAERRAIWETAIVAVSIRAIDGVPTWKVFNVKPEPEEMAVLYDELKPPKMLRLRATIPFMAFLSDANAVLAQRLFNVYQDKLDPRAEVLSYLTDPNNPRFRYGCEENGCQEQIVRMPIKNALATGEVELVGPFCPLHGVRMTAKTKVLGDRDLPLS